MILLNFFLLLFGQAISQLLNYTLPNSKLIVPADEDVVLVESTFLNIHNLTITPISFINGTATPYNYPEVFFACRTDGNVVTPTSRDVSPNTTGNKVLAMAPAGESGFLVMKEDSSLSLMQMTLDYYSLKFVVARNWNNDTSKKNWTLNTDNNRKIAVFTDGINFFTVPANLSKDPVKTIGLQNLPNGMFKFLVYNNYVIVTGSASFSIYAINSNGSLSFVSNFSASNISKNTTFTDFDICDSNPNPISLYFLDLNSGIQLFLLNMTSGQISYQKKLADVINGSLVSARGDLIYVIENALGKTYIKEYFYENRLSTTLNWNIPFLPVSKILHGERYVFFEGSQDTHAYLYAGFSKDFVSLSDVFGKYVDINVKMLTKLGYLSFGKYPSNFFTYYGGEYIFLHEFIDKEPSFKCASNKNGKSGDVMNFTATFISQTCPNKPSNASKYLSNCIVFQNFELAEKSTTAALDQGINGLGVGLGIGIPLFLILGGGIFYYWYRQHRLRMDSIQKQFDDLRFKKFGKGGAKDGFSPLDKEEVGPEAIKMEIE